MSHILIIPVSEHAKGCAVANAIATALPSTAIQATLDKAGEAEHLISSGKSDDWLDGLVAEVSKLDAQNIVLKGIRPDANRVFLSAKNVDIALSFNATVVFALAAENHDASYLANCLNLAKQAFVNAPHLKIVFTLDDSDLATAEEISKQTHLTYIGSSQALQNTDVFLQNNSNALSPAQFRVNMMTSARNANKRIVLPEGAEPRTVAAAAICHEKGIARCVLLASEAEVKAVAQAQNITLPDSLEIIDPATLVDQYVEPMCELRKSKGLTPEDARQQLQDTVVLGTMMMAQNDVDGLVSGAVHTTANTIRPALQLIKTAPGASLVSSVFFMLLPNQVLVYGDCAVNPEPSAQQLADIAIQSADSAKAFGITPKVALISYSTGTSGSGPAVEKVAEAVKIAQEKRPDLDIDGPLQYDAATVPSVAKSKAPNSKVAGQATVLVFPDLNTGNCTYKAVQRNANVLSVGPMLQGLRKPVNDLSRGALVDDIVYTIALTAIQATQL